MKALAAVAILFLSIGKCNDLEEEIVPPCILQRIEEIKSQGVWSPAATVWKISTAGHGILYYIPDHCCDYYSELYDDQCHLLCAPEGGIGGGGTGDCPDYIEIKRELYWTDPRE